MFERRTICLKNCKQAAENCKQTAENQKNCTPLKHILALPTWGQKSFVSELWPFEIQNSDLGHPVITCGLCPQVLGLWLRFHSTEDSNWPL